MTGNQRRLAIVAHFNSSGGIDRGFLRFLAGLREVSSRIVVGSTSSVTPDACAELLTACDRVFQRPNVGFDFSTWRDALEQEDLEDYDELLLTNSSLVGPVTPLSETFERMSNHDCDYWGLVDNCSPLWHVQSFFLVFRKTALHHRAFKEFFAGIIPYARKDNTILSFELGLSAYFVQFGLRPAVLLSQVDVMRYALGRSFEWRGRPNVTYHFPVPLLDLGFPFVKMEALRGVRPRAQAGPIRRLAEAYRQKRILSALEQRGYDTAHLEIPPPRILSYYDENAPPV